MDVSRNFHTNNIIKIGQKKTFRLWVYKIWSECSARRRYTVAQWIVGTHEHVHTQVLHTLLPCQLHTIILLPNVLQNIPNKSNRFLLSLFFFRFFLNFLCICFALSNLFSSLNATTTTPTTSHSTFSVFYLFFSFLFCLSLFFSIARRLHYTFEYPIFFTLTKLIESYAHSLSRVRELKKKTERNEENKRQKNRGKENWTARCRGIFNLSLNIQVELLFII